VGVFVSGTFRAEGHAQGLVLVGGGGEAGGLPTGIWIVSQGGPHQSRSAGSPLDGILV
jgi:hypothetical protein